MFAVRVHLYQGRSLPPQDDSGSICAFVRVHLGAKTYESKPVYSTAAPAWYQTLTLDQQELPSKLPFAPLVHVELYHKTRCVYVCVRVCVRALACVL
jgi:hypothetical protein